MDASRNGTGGGVDIFDMLLKNPDLISKISKIMSGFNQPVTGQNERTPESNPDLSEEKTEKNKNDIGMTTEESHYNSNTEGNGGGGLSDISSRLSSLLSNKELMSKIPDILAAFKPSSSDTASSGGTAAAGAIIPTGHHHQKLGYDKRNTLILALKPYLNSRRREAIDYIIKIEKFGDIIGALS